MSNGQLKKQLTENKDWKEYDLQDHERRYIMSLLALNESVAHTVEQLSGMYLAFIAGRLGYNPNDNLQFDFDPAKKTGKLRIKMINMPPRPSKRSGDQGS